MAAPAAIALAALGAGAASADATMTAIGGRGQVTVSAKGDDTTRECDFSVLDPSRETIASKEVILAPKATQTVKLTSIPSGSFYTVVMDCTGQNTTSVESIAVRPAPDPH
jgi:type 1 fimbria pilin